MNQHHDHQPELQPEPSLRPFAVMWGGQAFSLFGSHLVQFALVWYLTESTGSATVLAFATMMALLPEVLISPFAGALVDRWDRRRVMIAADAGIAVTTLILAALFATGSVQVWHIYAAMLVRATGGAFHWPAMQASTTLMVPRRHLSRVAGFNQALRGAAAIAAPPLGAILLGVLPIQGVLAIDVLTALVAIAPLLFIHVPQPEQAPGERLSVLGDLLAGVRFVGSWPGLLLIIGMVTVINLLSTPAFSLLPLMVTDHFRGGALELATLQSAEGIGMIVGGLLLGVWGGFRKRILTALAGLVGLGLAIVVIGLTPGNLLVLAVGAMFVTGFMVPIVNGSFFGVMQATVPPAMQGRVLTLTTAGAVTAATLVGLPVAGPVSDMFGVPTWFVVGGVVTALMGVVGLFIPSITEIEALAAETLGGETAPGGEPTVPVGLE